jgi:single-strand DNA-binding protein
VGRLVRDPELRTTQSGTPVVSFTVACDRRYVKEGEERQADFINCVAWNGTADFVSKYFTKGMRIALEGRIQTRTYDDQEGNKRFVTEVIAEAVEFAQSKNENSSNNAPAYSAPATPSAPAPDGFTPVDVEEEDLPF